ncbi:MAG TPA: hypothetical protein VJT82_03380, partial [Pyrinomonadaceae bacterium]|nr:hypothetical protein [Pyrinomonadaceae bacterium]
GKFHRIEVNVKDRPDLSVLVQRGFYSAPPPDDAPRNEAKRNEAKGKTNDAAPGEQTKTLFAALRSPFPKTALQTSLALNYYDLPPDGMILTASVQVDFEASKATDGAASQPERAEIIGALYNDKGEVKKTFQRGLSFAQAASNASPNARRYLILSNNMAVTPGLYQVRVAARDPRTGRTGSAMQWLEVPDLAKGALAMSSIFIGERSDKEAAPASGEQSVGAPVVINVDRRFARSSRMRFMTYVYNAARPQSASPDVAVQVQVFRDEQPVVTSPLSKMDTEGVTDFVRLPYAAELPLGGLTPGSYVLKITAIDRVAKKSVTQRTRFIVE